MITDNERREVARRLREIRLCKSGHIEWWKIAQALGLKEPAGLFGWEKFEPDSANRLADLIEPQPTCRFYDPEDGMCLNVRTARPCDREALLALADEMDRKSNDGTTNPDPMRPLATSLDLFGYARRIREALGVTE